MRLNSPAQMETGRRLIAKYGSWSAVRENSVRQSNGVWVVRPDDMGRLREAAARLGRAD